ncbi:unnamed protein product [Mesocestoides corti]|uniref:G_PROTEIN_RECEP_F1_2 domain-containing protein n=1 Tax=Mesocestoides corti TaxID=53468 RepID=A0A0R3UEN1_MESCO|nr:unnamed protein product [Mesocestoides corti]
MKALSTLRIIPMNNTPSNSAIFSDDEVARAVAVMAAVIVIGCIGNTLVIVVLCLKNSSTNSRWNRYRRRQQNGDADTSTFGRDKTLDFFILVLAGSDLLVCVIIIPSTITMELYQFRISIDILCKLFYIMFVTNTTFSSLLISAVALDRYLFICHSLKQILTLLRAKILVSTLAIFSLCVGIAAGCVVGVKSIQANNSGISNPQNYICEENEYVRGISELQKTVSQIIKYINHACYLACILIVLILYSCVFRAIVSSRSRRDKLAVQQRQQQNGSDSSEQRKPENARPSRQLMVSFSTKIIQKAQFTLQNLRSALMLFIIALVYILTFVPALVIANGWAHQNLVLFYLYYVNSAANPCIYAIFTPSFRQFVATIFRDCFCDGKMRQSSSSGAAAIRTGSLMFQKMGKKGKSIEDAYPFVSREERMASAALPSMDSNAPASDS